MPKIKVNGKVIHLPYGRGKMAAGDMPDEKKMRPGSMMEGKKPMRSPKKMGGPMVGGRRY